MNSKSKSNLAAVLARVDPKTAVRLLSVNKETANAARPVVNRLRALKHRVRTLVARRRHYNNHGRLSWNLVQEKGRAIARARMTPEQKKRLLERQRAMAAARAYARYQNDPGSWNSFVRIHVKAGRSGNITRNQARNMYGRSS